MSHPVLFAIQMVDIQSKDTSNELCVDDLTVQVPALLVVLLLVAVR